MLIGRARKADIVQRAHRALCAVAACHPCRPYILDCAVLAFQRRIDALAVLLQVDKLGVPFDSAAEVSELLAHDALIVVLAEHQDEGKGCYALARIAQRHARHAPAPRPEIGTRALLAQLERALSDSKLLVDFERARLDAQSTGLARSPGMAVDDAHGDSAPLELIGKHQPGRPRAHDEHIAVHAPQSSSQTLLNGGDQVHCGPD